MAIGLDLVQGARTKKTTKTQPSNISIRERVNYQDNVDGLKCINATTLLNKFLLLTSCLVGIWCRPYLTHIVWVPLDLHEG